MAATPPGTKLDAQGLAERFGVSRTPIRETFGHLAAMGLVTHRPNREVIVANLSPEALGDLYEAMAELESALTRLATLRMNAGQRQALFELHQESVHLVRDGHADDYARYNQRFHELIFDGAHSSQLQQLAETTRRRLAPFHDWSRHRWSSGMTWPDLLESAIALARDGYEVSANQAFWTQQRREIIRGLPDLMTFCCDRQGEGLAAGSHVIRPELATTLAHLAHHGIDDFYDGELGQALAQGFQKLGNGLTGDDLSKTRAWHSNPLSIRYRAGTLYNFPPPTQGLYTLRAINALNHVDLTELDNGGADYLHYLVEAIKAQLKNRNSQLCDPTVSSANRRAADSLDTQRMLSQEQAAADFEAIDPERAVPWKEQGKPADTVWLAATDNEGRTACLMQSLFHDFGSGCVIGDTGILWLNRAAGFNPDPAHTNAWAPGKRPAHTLNPSAYLADDGRQFYFGTQGGDGQPQTQMVLATQLVDFNQSVGKALSAPRFLQGRSFFGSSEKLKLERSIDSAVAEELVRRGHEVEWIPKLSPFTGLAGVLALYPDGRREAIHDPRG